MSSPSSPFDTIWALRNPVTGWWGTVLRTASGGLIVSPSFAATALVGVTGAAHSTVTPAFAAAALRNRKATAALTVTPTFAASAGITVHGSAALSVTPSFAASAVAFLPASAALSVTPTFAAAASVLSGPVFDAVGSGGHVGLGTSMSGTHTATAGATVFAFVNGAATISSVTYNGVSMTSVGSIQLNNTTGRLALYKLSSAPSGSQTVTVTQSTSAGSFGTVSYTGVTTVGTPSTTFGSGTSLSQGPLTCSTNQIILECLGHQSTISSPSGGTSRYTSATSAAVAIQDSSTSTTFTATGGAATAWAGIGVVLS